MKLIPGEELATLAFRAALVLGVIGVLWFGLSRTLDFIRAPVQTELNVSRANNQGFKAAAEASNKGVDGLQAESKARIAKSRAATENAGKPEAARSKAILEAPCTWGKTDYECANGRVNRELGLQ